MNSNISNANSTNKPLRDAQYYRGYPEKLESYSSLVISVHSDRSGQLEVNWMHAFNGSILETETFDYTSGLFTKTLLCKCRFAQVCFLNNSGADQTTFSLQTLLKSEPLISETMDITVDSQALESTYLKIWDGVDANGASSSLDINDKSIVECYGHVNSACDLKIQFSPDGTDWYDGDHVVLSDVSSNFYLQTNSSSKKVRMYSNLLTTGEIYLTAK